MLLIGALHSSRAFWRAEVGFFKKHWRNQHFGHEVESRRSRQAWFSGLLETIPTYAHRAGFAGVFTTKANPVA